MKAKYKTKRIKYRIAVPSAWTGSEVVSGYAIDSGLPVHIAIHSPRRGVWKFDHWETGGSFGYVFIGKFEDAVEEAVKIMRDACQNGRFSEAIKTLKRTGKYMEINR